MAAVSENAAERPSSATDFVERLRTALARGRSRIHRRTQFPRRLAASIGVVAIVSLSSCALWSTRWCRSMENRVLDAKWSLLPKAPPSPEILLVTIDDRWIAAQSRSLSQQGDLFGERLSSLFSAGARAIAFDVVLPKEWSEAEEFTRLVLSHADRLTLAAFGSFTDGTIRGRECIHPVAESILGPERMEGLFGLENLEADEDGAERKSRWGFADREGRVHLSWAARAARTLREDLPAREEFYLDQSAPLDSVATIALLDLPAALESSPDLLRGKLLVLGATFEGSADTFRAIDEKGEARSLPGAYVQANLVRTLVSGVQLKEVRNLALLAVCSILVAAAATPVILHASPLVSWLAPLAVLLLFAAASFAAFRALHVQIPTAGPMASFGIAIAAAFAMRRVLR
jgi:CHASE2 domain-containing sensor protein